MLKWGPNSFVRSVGEEQRCRSVFAKCKTYPAVLVPPSCRVRVRESREDEVSPGLLWTYVYIYCSFSEACRKDQEGKGIVKSRECMVRHREISRVICEKCGIERYREWRKWWVQWKNSCWVIGSSLDQWDYLKNSLDAQIGLSFFASAAVGESTKIFFHLICLLRHDRLRVTSRLTSVSYFNRTSRLEFAWIFNICCLCVARVRLSSKEISKCVEIRC